MALRAPFTFTLVAVVGAGGGAALGDVAMALRDLIGVDAVACDIASAIWRVREKGEKSSGNREPESPIKYRNCYFFIVNW